MKTASCSLKDGWDYDSEPLPNIGSLTIVTDWEGRPICITQLTDIRIEKFKDVTEDFAQAEGREMVLMIGGEMRISRFLLTTHNQLIVILHKILIWC
nr:ASCH domain-containing protein [Psychrobacter sp. PraFG1]